MLSLPEQLNWLASAVEKPNTKTPHISNIRLLLKSFVVGGASPKTGFFCSTLLKVSGDSKLSAPLSQALSELNNKILPKLRSPDGSGIRLTRIQKVRGENRFEPVFKSSSLQLRVDDDYHMLANRIKKMQKVSDAVLIQYSGQHVTTLCTTLLDKGANVEIYLQHPDSACHPRQSEKIKGLLPSLTDLFRDGPGTLKVFLYKATASLRAVSINDGTLLSVGWYTFHQFNDHEISVYGHSRPMVMAAEGCRGFEELRQNVQFRFARHKKVLRRTH